MTTRREFLGWSALAGLAGAALPHANAIEAATSGPAPRTGEYIPVETVDGSTLEWKLVDGVKVFHLVAGAVTHEFAPGLEGECWGYNGRVHGPTIEAVEGDRVRIYVTNRLDTATSVHWHGLFLPNGMDGVAGLTQRPIEPDETFRYEFTLKQHGTFMYHPHHDEMTQMAMGLMGLFIVHPRTPVGPPVDRDFAYMLSEWAMKPGRRRPDPNEMMDFNVLTLNGRVFPATSPMVVKTGQRVRIRFGNLSAMDHHPMHLHGHSFKVVATDGGAIPESAQWPETTVLVPTGSTRTVEFVADAPGDWAMHCHMTHHIMNQMGHGIPTLVGVDPSVFDHRIAELLPQFSVMGSDDAMDEDDSVPSNSIAMMGGPGAFGFITMGGMVSVLKVRDDIEGYDDPGWFDHPEGTIANPATTEELSRDGIDV